MERPGDFEWCSRSGCAEDHSPACIALQIIAEQAEAEPVEDAWLAQGLDAFAEEYK